MISLKNKFNSFLKKMTIGLTLLSSCSFAEQYNIGAVVSNGFVTPEYLLSDINSSISPPSNNCASPSYGGCDKFTLKFYLKNIVTIPNAGMYGIPLINIDSPNEPPKLYLVLVSGVMEVGLSSQTERLELTPKTYPNIAVYLNLWSGQSTPPRGRQKTSNIKYRIYSIGRADPGHYSIKDNGNNDIITFSTYGESLHPGIDPSGTSGTTEQSRRVNSFLVRPACTVNNPAVIEWKNVAIKPVQGTSYGTKSTTLNYSCETGLNAISVFSKVTSGITDINKKKLFLNNTQTGPYITGSLKNTPPGCSGGDFLFDGETPLVGSNAGNFIMQWDLCSDGRPEAGKNYSGAIDVFILAK